MSETQMNDRTDDAPTSRGRHPVNVGHLVMGLAFAGLVAVWALIQSDLVDDDDIRWLLPLPWVVAGAVGLLAAALGGRKHLERPAPDAGWVGGTAAATPEPATGDDTSADTTTGTAADNDPEETR